MSIAEVAQIFGVGVALMGLAFWSGVLSNRVRSIERQLEREEPDGKKLVRVEVTLDNMGHEIASIKRAIEGIQRQLANLVSGKSGVFLESHMHANGPDDERER